MVPLAFVRQYAGGQQIEVDVADQEIVIHYALGLLNRAGRRWEEGTGRGSWATALQRRDGAAEVRLWPDGPLLPGH